MNKLTKYLVEGILQEAETGIIVLLPGGFKPPHGGHLELAKRYATQPNVSKVEILIGPNLILIGSNTFSQRTIRFCKCSGVGSLGTPCLLADSLRVNSASAKCAVSFILNYL